MIDYENIRLVVAKGIKDYCKCRVIRSNQNEPLAEEEKPYPYISYTITTLKGENGGTYGIYEDGARRKPVPQIWSLTAVSDDDSECVALACKAHDWLDEIGRTLLTDNGITVVSVGGITNRDNFITVGYEYRKGFDFTLSFMDEIEGLAEQEEYIETFELNGINVKTPPTMEQLNTMLEKRLDGEVG